MTWSGLYTALITPFKEGRLDLTGLETLLERQKQSGVKGVVLFGSTGEGSTLSREEKELILKATKKKLGSCIKLVVGIGSPSTATTIENGLWAEDLGADAFLVVAPYYNRPTQEGIYSHYEELSLKTSTPFFVYNIPGRTGINIEVATLKKIATLPRAIGMKESPLNFSQVIDVIQDMPKEFALLCGDDLLTLPMLSLGGKGVISVVSNLFPKKMQDLVDAALENKFLEARQHHEELYPLLKALLLESNPIPIKAALHHFNLPSGAPRMPLTPLLEKNREHLVAILKKYEGCT